MNTAELQKFLEEGNASRDVYSLASGVPVEKLKQLETTGEPYMTVDPRSTEDMAVPGSQNYTNGSYYRSSGMPMIMDTGNSVGAQMAGKADPRTRKLVYDALMNNLKNSTPEGR